MWATRAAVTREGWMVSVLSHGAYRNAGRNGPIEFESRVYSLIVKARVRLAENNDSMRDFTPVYKRFNGYFNAYCTRTAHYRNCQLLATSQGRFSLPTMPVHLLVPSP